MQQKKALYVRVLLDWTITPVLKCISIPVLTLYKPVCKYYLAYQNIQTAAAVNTSKRLICKSISEYVYISIFLSLLSIPPKT